VCNGLLYATQRFAFDHIFNESSSQSEVYESAAQPAVVSALQGYNAAIIAYGQTGTGKTYTMEGVHDDPVHQGIVPRAIKDIFRSISADSTPHHQYLVRASYLQIYNEVISDLLKPERSNLVIRCGPWYSSCIMHKKTLNYVLSLIKFTHFRGPLLILLIVYSRK
jgi:kinesin family protein 3/17